MKVELDDELTELLLYLKSNDEWYANKTISEIIKEFWKVTASESYVISFDDLREQFKKERLREQKKLKESEVK